MYALYSGKRILCVGPDEMTATSGQGVAEVSDQLLAELGPEGVMSQCEVLGNRVYKKNAPRDLSGLKLAFIGVWGIPCGIYTYSEALYPHFQKHFKQVRWFCEEADIPYPNDDWLVPCFKRGESLAKLNKALSEYKPDVVFIQHEYGIFPNAAHWLAFLSDVSWKYEVFAQLHSVYRHKDKTICEAAIPNILVHSQLAKDVLEEKGIRGSIRVVSHFCPPLGDQTRLWNLYQRNHTLVQFGFGFEYKGWEQALQIVASLKPKYPDIFYTAVMSTAAHANHDALINRLHDLAESLGLQDNVAIIKGFQTDEVIESYLRTNQVALFPYISNKDHEVFGASGASRHGIRFGVPTVVSGVPHFYDLRGVCAYGSSPAEMAQEIDNLFSNKEYRDEVVKRQNEFALAHSPEKTVERICTLMSSPGAE